jgi:hypothetical protein
MTGNLAPALRALGLTLCRNCTAWTNDNPTATAVDGVLPVTITTTGCERCHGSGREHLWWLTITGGTDARRHLALAYGPNGTPRPIIDQAPITDDEADDLARLLAAVPGLVIRDRRP